MAEAVYERCPRCHGGGDVPDDSGKSRRKKCPQPGCKNGMVPRNSAPGVVVKK